MSKKASSDISVLLSREQEARVQAEAAKDGALLLSEITSILNTSLDYEASLQMLPQLIVPRIADMCIVWVLEDDERTISPLAATHARRDLISSFHDLISRYPADIRRREGVGKVIRTGQSVLYRQIPDTLVSGFARDEHHLKEILKNRSKSYIAVPLKARGRTLGAISLITAEWGREYDESDLEFAEELAGRVSIVLDNARLYSSLKATLAEKQALLEELHHRVKNNLQVISSLLSLEASGLTDPAALKPLEESQKRIHALALLHEKLYCATNLARIDLADYLRSVAQYLLNSYQASARHNVALEVHIQKVQIGIQQALPIGLIVNEIMTNSFKYAFTEKIEEGKVRLRLRAQDETLILTVSDNGAGLPEDLNVADQQTLGLKLIHILANQVEGKVEVQSSPTRGTIYKITCPMH